MTQAKAKEREILFIPFENIKQFRVVQDGNRQGEYVIKGYGKDGALVGYDISGIVAKQDPEKPPQCNPIRIAVDNGPGKGWTHMLRGTADNPWVMNAVMRKLSNRSEYIVAFREFGGWAIVGNQYGGELEVRTGGYMDCMQRKWNVTSPMDWEIECAFQLYPNCIFCGQMEILPLEDLFTANP